MMNAPMRNTIDLTPYLPVYTPRKTRRHFSQLLQTIGLVIEGVVTLGIGLCLMVGLYVFFTIL